MVAITVKPQDPPTNPGHLHTPLRPTITTPAHPVLKRSLTDLTTKSASQLTPPTAISLDEEPEALDIGSPKNSLPGPSQPYQHACDIPLPSRRRHRGGVLFSRSRASSAGTSFESSMDMTNSLSFGDLASLGRRPSASTEDEEEVLKPRSRSRDAQRRVFSETGRQQERVEDLADWDNSARFYHRLHSRPGSRAGSRPTSPLHSPQVSPRGSKTAETSPVFARRRLTLPPNNVLLSPPPPPGAGLSAQLSPNHYFLQQHLPPTFPHTWSPELRPIDRDMTVSPMVIMTPTTDDWKVLKEISRTEGEDLPTSEESSEGTPSPDQSPSQESVERMVDSLTATPTISRMGDGRTERPRLRPSISADIIQAEPIHTADPGGSAANPITPEKPNIIPVIIASSPVAPVEQVAPQPQQELHDLPRPDLLAVAAPRAENKSAVDDIVIANDLHKSKGFVSFGRRDSLRSLKKPTLEPRTKSKRELERERLFKLVDAELEKEANAEVGSPSSDDGRGVQQIGLARRRDTESSSGQLDVPVSSQGPKSAGFISKDSIEGQTDLRALKRSSLPPLTRSIIVSPTQPIRSSPLHASPVMPGQPFDGSADSSRSQTPNSAQSGLSSPQVSNPNLGSIRDYARALSTHHSAAAEASSSPKLTRSPRQRDTSRVSLVAGRLVQPFTVPPTTSLPPPSPALSVQSNLQSFSPFRSPSLGLKLGVGTPPTMNRLDTQMSFAPSVGAPSTVGTPTSETASGIGGRGIDDYVILKEAGKGAYGLVMRAKVKGPTGEPVGDEVIIKYIIKGRILADCWKKHKILGPIPVEIHVMDQLRHLLYIPPPKPHPWDPARPRPGQLDDSTSEDITPRPFEGSGDGTGGQSNEIRKTNGEDASIVLSIETVARGGYTSTQRYLSSEMRYSPERGHPNICKLLDFFEDREFYYLVMPRFGTGVDLFDRVEASPTGLDPFEVRSLMGQLADAVRFLHANGIVHRDIKDENVILDGTGHCQLIDFGSAAHWRPGKKWDTFSGTLHYASPEILRGEMYGGKEQDVWALGVLGYVLLVGETPFSALPEDVLEGLTSESVAAVGLHSRCEDGHEDEGRERDGGGRLGDAADLVRRCLEMIVGDRPSAEMICQHRFLVGENGWVGHRGWVK
ncbi:CAMK/CAMKL/PASK protein kinase [Tremella mesenterica]|uniref:CAMK/CAMKL/PASK protein kinase n=1 Tax=Tremella mesenterica TaxID=5217 RepID=A0A4Q1BUC1_TREME|nr:CAMK/CAMKL/PASK protein kinase [Tremella mesenterica]